MYRSMILIFSKPMKVEDWVVSVREVIDQEIKGSYLLICHSLGAFVGLVRL